MQVLTNLVKNALNFTSVGRIDIKVFYDRQDQRLIVHVCDTGIGIARDKLSTLFDHEFGEEI